MKKVIAFSLYGPLAASYRYRLGQFVLELAKYGIELEIHYLLGNDYLQNRYEGKHKFLKSLAKSYRSYFKKLFDLKQYDLIILYAELLPLTPGWVERFLLRGRNYIYDFDDALYLRYSRGRLGYLQAFFGRKFETIIEGAAAVTAGNKTLENYATRFNRNVIHFPTVVDINRYQCLTKQRDECFRVGWIGSPTTAKYLTELIEPLSIIGRESPVKFIVVGGCIPEIPNVEVIPIPWREETEIELINRFDVGVMPMPDNEWSRGKCAFKLIQYMACGLPVIGSRVGANVEVVTPECGFLVLDSKDWIAALRFIRDHPDQANRMGKAGRSRIEAHYSLTNAASRLASLIIRLVEIKP